ncbi:DNA-binding XRE family transcriptional regulator [Pedobacter sp. UYP24]
MKIKVDEFVRNEVTKSGKTQTSIAKDVGISRVQLGKILALPEMEMKYVLGIGNSIRYDFSNIFPQLNTEVVSSIVDGNHYFETANNLELRNQLLEIQQKYIKLLEAHVDLLHKLK